LYVAVVLRLCCPERLVKKTDSLNTLSRFVNYKTSGAEVEAHGERPQKLQLTSSRVSSAAARLLSGEGTRVSIESLGGNWPR
jgi:hypothetical protein